jgi:altronate hydrolase
VTPGAILLHPDDTVICLLRDHPAGAVPVLAGLVAPALHCDIALGHKMALIAHASGAPVVKYGAVIGHATCDIAPGDHVHLHNLAGVLA